MSNGTPQNGNAIIQNGHDWDLGPASRDGVNKTTCLLAEYHATGNVELRNQAVQANLRLVAYIANRFKGRGLSVDELMSEGAAALLRAAETFDTTRGVSFGAYAATAITHSMRRALGTARNIVAIPSQVRRQISKSRRAADAFFVANGHQPNKDDLPRGAKPATPPGVIAPTLPVTSCDAEGCSEMMPSPRADSLEVVASADIREHVREALGSLEERTAEVLSLRFGLDTGTPRTWQRVAQQLDISVSEAKARASEGMAALRVRLGKVVNDGESSVAGRLMAGLAA